MKGNPTKETNLLVKLLSCLKFIKKILLNVTVTITKKTKTKYFEFFYERKIAGIICLACLVYKVKGFEVSGDKI